MTTKPPNMHTLMGLPEPSLKAPPPTAFPTFAELVELEATNQAPPKRSSGLFEQLLGKRVEHLYQDALEQPSKYSEQNQQLMLQLLQGKRQYDELSDEEKDELDRCTIEFATAKKPTEEGVGKLGKTPPLQQKTRAKKMPTPRKSVDRPGVVSAEGMPPFWWL